MVLRPLHAACCAGDRVHGRLHVRLLVVLRRLAGLLLVRLGLGGEARPRVEDYLLALGKAALDLHELFVVLADGHLALLDATRPD